MKRKREIFIWLRAFRLQFYLMAFIAYSLGARFAFGESQVFSLKNFLVGYLLLFLIELITVLTNEYFDYPSDRINKNYSIFTGGSRVLVDKNITFREMKIAIGTGILLLGALSVYLVKLVNSGILFLIALGFLLGLGYTFPPLKLSHRGMGELVVGFTHSFYLVSAGYYFQAFKLDPGINKSAIPLFWAVLAAITLAGIPDAEADAQVFKRTWAVILGSKRAAQLAVAFIILAGISGYLIYQNIFGISWSALYIFPLINGLIVLFATLKFLVSQNYNRKINFLLGSALNYIIWFGLIPLLLSL